MEYYILYLIGNSPFGYAEYATLEDFCLITSIDISKAKKKLKQKGIKVASTKDTLKSISSQNDISPKDIFSIIKDDTTKISLPTDIPIGIAQKPLKTLAKEYKIDLDNFLQHLKYYGINATPNMNFKKLAMKNNLHPAELYNLLLASQKKIKKEKR